jgi:hypothetical protein
MCVMMAESGVSARAHNPNGHASGLIQWMPATLVGLGYHEGHEKFRTLRSLDQLPYVQAYFGPHIGLLDSVAAIYTATFLPVHVRDAGDPNFVLAAKGGHLGWAYGPNAGFDKNGDLAITVEELEQAVTRNCRGPRWAELVRRLEANDNAEVTVSEWPSEMFSFDLRTTRGIQLALAALGLAPGPADGIPGPLTRGAVIAFQVAHGLQADGIVGPLTRKELDTQVAQRT